ncbi:MAG: hypothetical protein Q6J33_02030 [Gloeomargarita sp. DG_2_bins_126]
MVKTAIVLNSVVQKGFIALSGLLLFGFVLFHLGGNFLLLDAPGKYNHLAQELESWGWLFHGLEIILAMALIGHIWLTISIRRQQKKFHPRYTHLRQKERWVGHWSVNLTSRLMTITGPLILLFLLVHLGHFRLHPPPRNLEQMVQQFFQSPLWVWGYELALIPVGFHLAHGISSAWQSLGLGHAKMTPSLPYFSQMLSGLIMLGYAVIPLAIYLQSP